MKYPTTADMKTFYYPGIQFSDLEVQLVKNLPQYFTK